MAPYYKFEENPDHICHYFESNSPDNCYSFCKYATVWIDGQRERTCPYPACPYVASYSPVLKGIYCNRSSE